MQFYVRPIRKINNPRIVVAVNKVRLEGKVIKTVPLYSPYSAIDTTIDI